MAEGITSISVRGYKSLVDECTVDVHPLTVLTGPNGSGKSSIMEPLLMMKQTLQSSYDPGPLQICGPDIRFSTPGQFISRAGGGLGFTVRLEVNFGAASLEETFDFGADCRGRISRAVYTDMGEVTTLREDMTHEDLASFMPRWQEENREILEEKLRRPVRWRVARERCFLLPRAVSGCEGELQHFSFSLPSEPFDLAIRGLIHVPALRGPGGQPFTVDACGQFFDDHAGDAVAGSRAEDLERWLDSMGIQGCMGQDVIAGTGAFQVFPVLVALLAAAPGQMVYIEHPESHLSPEAQVGLSGALAQASGRGARIIVETHSRSIVENVREMADAGRMAPGTAQIYRFQRTGRGTASASPVWP